MAYLFTTIDDPLGTSFGSSLFNLLEGVFTGKSALVANGTFAMDVNSTGAIVGLYVASNGNTFGFTYDGTTYTTISGPTGSLSTIAFGINGLGQIVGDSSNASGVVQGFSYSNGTYTTINDPLGNFTLATGINDHGQVVGAYANASFPADGFLYSNGAYTKIDDPKGISTIAWSINNSGDIVGEYADSNGLAHGFLFSAGVYTTIDDPLAGGGFGTFLTGINGAGQIVGFYTDASGNFHAFLYTNGTFATINDPSQTSGSLAWGINDVGEIVGTYLTGSLSNGFLAAPETLTASEITTVYMAVLQRPASQLEINNWLMQDASVGDAAIISQIVSLPEVQFNVYPIIQIIQLATGVLPNAHQLAGWVPFIEQNGVLQGQSQTNPLLDQMALAFVASDNFGNVYNGGTDVDPNSTVTAQEIQVIIKAATGIAATQAQVNAWISTGQTIDQVFVDFALGDQYTAFSRAGNQQYLTTVADTALGSQVGTIIGSSEASHSLLAHA